MFVNDANYVVCPLIDGKQVWCKYYAVWMDMKKRCSSEKFKAKYPSYKDVDCCDEWKTFSKFKDWMEQQPWRNMQLDKDLLVAGNKTYSPEKCVFVPHKINSLLLDNFARRGEFPIGVYKNKSEKTNPFMVSCCTGDGEKERKYLGKFSSPTEAHRAWQIEKANQIENRVFWWAFNPSVNHTYREDVAISLLDRAEKLRQDFTRRVETVKI